MEFPEPFFCVKEIANIFGVTRRTVRGWPGRGCPHADVSDPGAPRRRLRFRVSEVKEWGRREHIVSIVDRVVAEMSR